MKRNTDLLAIRGITYKEACRMFHPDNKETGDEGVFKFIQDVKTAFWDYKGNPRKKIEHEDWDIEKKIDEQGMSFFYNFGA